MERFAAARWVVALPAIRVCTTFVSLELGERARRSQQGGTGTSALQRMGWGAKRPGTLAQRPTRAASRGERGEGQNLS